MIRWRTIIGWILATPTGLYFCSKAIIGIELMKPCTGAFNGSFSTCTPHTISDLGDPGLNALLQVILLFGLALILFDVAIQLGVFNRFSEVKHE